MDIANINRSDITEMSKLGFSLEKEKTFDLIKEIIEGKDSQSARASSIDEKGILAFDENLGIYSKTEMNFDRKFHVDEVNIEVKSEELDDVSKNDQFILTLSKVFKITAIVNLIFDFLFAMTLPHLLPLILFNILGYCASKRFSIRMSIGYFLYNCLVIIARILLMIYFPITYIIVIYSLVVIVQVAFVMIHIAFISSLYEISAEQLIRILTLAKK